MRTLMLSIALVALAALPGAFGVSSQDLFPTPQGRLGGRETLPTPPMVAPTPAPSQPTPTPVAIPTPAQAATATAAPTANLAATAIAAVAASPMAEPGSPVVVEAGPLAAVRAGTVTVVTWRGGLMTIGSGWTLGVADLVVTASVVIAGADRVEVEVADGRRFSATVLGSNSTAGIAVVDAPGLGLFPLTLNGPAQPGQNVVAVGTAEGRFAGTMVVGVVSSTQGSLPGRYPPTSLIVTSAGPLAGMVGGPLVDEGTGGVVGLLVPGPSVVDRELPLPTGADGESAPALSARAGSGFAVPIAIVVRVAADLIEQGTDVYPVPADGTRADDD